MRTVKSGDPIKWLNQLASSASQAVDNSLMGRLLGLGETPPSSRDVIPQYDPNRSVYDVDPPGLPSSFDTFLQDWTPIGDIAAIVQSLNAAGRGDYLEASLVPLFMILPQSLGNRLRKSMDELRKVRMAGKIPEDQLAREVGRIAGDIDQISREALVFRQKNPQAYDQAMREVADQAQMVGTSPLHRVSNDDLVADAFISGRQRELGYTGRPGDPEKALTGSREALGGPPITTADKRGMGMVEGTPSELGKNAALMHQAHGSASGTGNLSMSDMQRMAIDYPLVRTPIPRNRYRVIRDGDEIRIPAGQMQQDDLILSLSQDIVDGGTYGGRQRLVSTGGTDLESNYMAFGPKAPMPNTTKFSLYGDEAMDFASDPWLVGSEFEDFAPDLGDFGDPNLPSFKIVKTKGMPVTRADMMRPGSGSRSSGLSGEDEFGVSALQKFRVLETDLAEGDVPYMIIAPELGARFKYDCGGKYKVLKR